MRIIVVTQSLTGLVQTTSFGRGLVNLLARVHVATAGERIEVCCALAMHDHGREDGEEEEEKGGIEIGHGEFCIKKGAAAR